MQSLFAEISAVGLNLIAFAANPMGASNSFLRLSTSQSSRAFTIQYRQSPDQALQHDLLNFVKSTEWLELNQIVAVLSVSEYMPL